MAVSASIIASLHEDNVVNHLQEMAQLFLVRWILLLGGTLLSDQCPNFSQGLHVNVPDSAFVVRPDIDGEDIRVFQRTQVIPVQTLG